MSGYSSVFWLALCASLTALGLVLTVLVGRRRSVRAMLHGAAWSLIPIAAYMTGSTQMLWRIGQAIGNFASSFVFDSLRWAGIGVVGLIVVLFLVGGGRARRRGARQARAAKAGARVEGNAQGQMPRGGTGAVTSGSAGSALTGDLAAGSTVPTGSTVPIGSTVPAGSPDAAARSRKRPGARRGKAAPTSNSAPGGKAAPRDDDLADIKEILRKRGILSEAFE